MGIQINGQTDTVSSTSVGGSVKVTPLAASTGLNVGTGASISSPATNVLTLGTNNVESIRINSSGHTIPGADNSYDLGINGTRWRNVNAVTVTAINYGSLGNYSALLGQIRVGADQFGNTIKVINDTNINITANNGIYFNTGAATDGSTTGTSRALIDSSGNFKLLTGGTKVLNSSGNPILNQTGSILQVVSTTKTDTFSTSASGDTAITGLSASITPSSTSNKILIMYYVNYDSTRGNSGGGFRIFRNGSHLTGSSGSVAGSRYTVSGDFGANANADQSGMHRSFAVLDSPSTTSSLTYQLYTYQEGTSFTTYINRARVDADQGDDPRMASTITLMEVAG